MRPTAATATLGGARWATWAWTVVPAIAVLELVLHLVQIRSVTTDENWGEARAAVKAIVQPDDLVVFAPSWTDPVGRMSFGDEIATLEREARADESRFPRAIEVSIRGKHAPELEGWRKSTERAVGRITISTFDNPSYSKTIDDLVTRVARPAGKSSVEVTIAEAGNDRGQETERIERPCSLVREGVQTGNLGFGPAIPADKFRCGGSIVGATVVADLDYHARRCIYATPPGGSSALRIKFKDIAFGKVLHGHHGLYAEAERHRDGAPVYLTFFAGDDRIGKVVHVDGEGWKGFELVTHDLDGKRGDLVAEVSAPNANRRMYCFEAITR